jgi:alpha-beta hydrolase superfamily lysophospholipase
MTTIIRRSEGRLTTPDGIALYEQHWMPMGAKASVVIVHGYGEHSSRYKHVADFLAEHGYAVQTYDQRGHGKTGNNLFIKSWDEFWADLTLMLNRARERLPNKPVFLYGHSMGGCIVASYVITQQPDEVTGIILSSALLKTPDNVSPLLIKMSALLSKLIPKLKTLTLTTAGLSQDPDVVAAYEADPLVYHDKLPVRIGSEMNRAVAIIQANMEALTLPVLIWHGTADVVTDPAGSQQLYERAQSADKTLKRYEGGFHEMHNEPNHDEVLGDLLAWLEARS